MKTEIEEDESECCCCCWRDWPESSDGDIDADLLPIVRPSTAGEVASMKAVWTSQATSPKLAGRLPPRSWMLDGGESSIRGEGMAQHFSLTSILPKLPAEAVSWIKGLSPEFYYSTETVLNIVGAESFIENWETHRYDQQKVAYDFGL